MLKFQTEFRVPVNITTPNKDKINGISNETIWNKALIPPMNGYLLFADHAERIVMIGKNPITANTPSNPKSISATTQPGTTGINATNAAAVATKSTGAAQKDWFISFCRYNNFFRN